MNWPVLAMAHHRLGHFAEARRWLERAHGRHGDPARGIEPGQDVIQGERWWDKADFRILLREADALFPAEDRPKDSFERAEFATICHNRQRFAAAARAYAEALEADPLLAWIPTRPNSANKSACFRAGKPLEFSRFFDPSRYSKPRTIDP